MPESQTGASAPVRTVVPTVSLLVPIYNVERYLRVCLESAAAQTLTDIEIICIDDGSTDGSRAIIDEFCAHDARFRLISKANSGYGDSMNRGLAAACGEFIGILESDDIMAPDALEKLVDAARGAHAEVAKGNFAFYWSAPNERREIFEMFRSGQCGRVVCPLREPYVFYQKPSIWSAIYRRDFLTDCNIRFLPTPGAAYQDASFAFKVWASAERVTYIHDAVLSYRQDNEASSVNSSGKVFCVCDEYAEIERWIGGEFAATHPFEEVDRLRRIEQAAKYDSYMWNYVRLAPQFRVDFLERMAEEFSRALDCGWFEERDLKPWKWANLKAIIRNPNRWERDNEAFAEAGAFGRAWYYLKLGGFKLLLAYARSRAAHEM